MREALEAAVVLAALGELVELALGLLDLVLRCGADRRFVGLVDHLFADIDKLATHCEIIDRAAIGFRIHNRCRFSREARELVGVHPRVADGARRSDSLRTAHLWLTTGD